MGTEGIIHTINFTKLTFGGMFVCVSCEMPNLSGFFFSLEMKSY